MKNKSRIISVIAGAAIVVGFVYLYDCQRLDLLDTRTQLEKSIEKSESLEQQIKVIKEENSNYTTIIEDQKNELVERDGTLEEYRRAIDRLEPVVEEHKKECPTRKVKARSGSPTIASSTSTNKGTPITMTLSFYGDGADENGGHAGITAYGQSLSAGMVASNTYPRGTQFSLNGQIFTVQDRGGSHFNSANRLDVFVPRLSGESNSAYKKRISQYGRRTVTMYKL